MVRCDNIFINSGLKRALMRESFLVLSKARLSITSVPLPLSRSDSSCHWFCPLLGITGCNWVEAWMSSWSELGIDIDKQPFGALCRAASPSGDLCKRACTSEEISVFINAILKATDSASSHSLKHTTLEWCSAYGLDEDARKLLGHHSLSGGKALAV